MAHTQGKKHQSNLAKRAARDAKETPVQPAPAKAVIEVKKFVKIGRPGYKGISKNKTLNPTFPKHQLQVY